MQGTMRRTKSDPVQFRLPLADYAVVERRAREHGMDPKDWVIHLTMADVEKHQTAEEREARATNP